MALPCCPTKTVCRPIPGSLIGEGSFNLDYDSPLANLSSELPDKLVFIGDNTGWNINVPPIGSNWATVHCLGVCESDISQEDADACARRMNLLCIVDEDWGPPPPPTPGVDPDGNSGPPLIPPPGTPIDLYSNLMATCITFCPDGTGFSYSTEAGKYIADSQILADRMAMSEACRFAVTAKICLGSLLDSTCIGSQYFSFMTPTGGRAPFNFRIVAGALPPGLDISIAANQRTMILSGITTTGGIYNFTIRADSAIGTFIQKTYTITVKGISTGSVLPDCTESTAYSQTLATSHMVPTLTWAVTSGALPPGLSLNPASGEIFGTPDPGSAGDYTFTITATEY